MPITRYIKGNLLDHNGPIAHGVNCQGKMASGVAKAIRDKYPEVFIDYIVCLEDCISHSLLEPPLGEVVTSNVIDGDSNRLIFHIFTQEFYGNDGKKYVDYGAIRKGFKECNSTLGKHDYGTVVLGIPKIGAGLGGGDWNIIEQIINDATPNLEIWVYEL
jgi:O-acetyl-ADP-ribose deacetylase (regulator of RNase III)